MDIRALGLPALALICACAPAEPTGLRRSDPGAGAQVRWDLTAKPLPDIPLPNDFATRYDSTSPTLLRLNASMLATTQWETHTREELDKLDGWGTFAPITVAFDQPLDVEPIFQTMHGDYDFSDDVVYVIDVSPDSPDFCQAVPLDMGKGNFPLYLQQPTYFPNDPRNATNQLLFEEVEEDLNRDGRIDPGEDTDMDGVLDHPNVRSPGAPPLDALLDFYERQTNTLIIRPVMPLREETAYAVVLMRGLLDEAGNPVRSPFPFINHAQQTAALQPLPGCLQRYGRTLDQVAFTWAFTTQSISRDFVAIRDGLYGQGQLAWLSDAQHYPVELSAILNLQSDSPDQQVANLKVVSEEQVDQILQQIIPLVGVGSKNTVQAILDSRKFVGYHAMGQFVSPQFFPRAADGKDGSDPTQWLPLYDQTWHVDSQSGRECSSLDDTGCTYTRPETVTFWLSVPKPEYAKSSPAPVVILGHGYGDSKVDMLLISGYFARHGMATIAIDCVSHGLGIDATTQQLVEGVFGHYNLEPMAQALLTGRAFDQNGDGIKDSGADFWTSYVFHTRDVVRQSSVDYMRLVQMLRSFDGVHRWKFDVNRDGQPELAGDFNADGVVDVGGSAPIYMLGVSLGGIMSSLVAGLEPAVSAEVSVSGGGGVMDVGIRSTEGGVINAVDLRTFGPLLLTLPEAGGVALWEYLPDLNKAGQLRLGPVSDPLLQGDTAVVRNLRSGEQTCGRIQAGGRLRVAVKSDQGDPLQLELYPGPLPSSPETGGCEVPTGMQPRTVINQLGAAVTFQGQGFPAGSPLVAFGDGFGLKRGTPDLRRFTVIGQIAMDPADPVNFAPNFEHRLLQYGTGETVRTRALVMSSAGDPIVPVATGAVLARAAGFIDFENKDPRYNKTDNQVLIDTYSLEGAPRAGRHVNAEGTSVLMDVEHLSAVRDGGVDGWDVPRLDPPLRLVSPSVRVGGTTGALFQMSNPQGMHVFLPPDPTLPFDVGTFVVNEMSHYLSTGGAEVSFDPCLIDSSCAWLPPLPP